MKTETKEIYKCEYCNKLYQIKSACIRHEPLCYKNPENIPACYNCSHLDKIDVKLLTEIETGGECGISYGEKLIEYSLLKCDIKNKFMIPIISHKKGNYIPNLLDEVEFEVMPLSCYTT